MSDELRGRLKEITGQMATWGYYTEADENEIVDQIRELINEHTAVAVAAERERECASAACAQINEWYVQAERKLDAVREALA